MQIQLKQVEIETALKQYISKQGIKLQGKEVTITFTAGRKEGGLSADMVIEEVDSPHIPGYTDTDEEDEASQVALTVVKPTDSGLAAGEVSPSSAIQEPEEKPAVAEETSSEVAPATVKPSSLFS